MLQNHAIVLGPIPNNTKSHQKGRLYRVSMNSRHESHTDVMDVKNNHGVKATVEMIKRYVGSTQKRTAHIAL